MEIPPVNIAVIIPNSRYLCFYTLLDLPHPSTAWSQEVLHNATQDLVKVFTCVFTNNGAAGFQATEAKRSHIGAPHDVKVKLESVNQEIALTSLSFFLSFSCPFCRSSLGRMQAMSPSPLHPHHLPPLRLSPQHLRGSRTPPSLAPAPPAPIKVSWRRCTEWAARHLWLP